MLPPAPPIFSTYNCWPRLSESFCEMIRAITSVGPPTGKPTTTRTGRVGYPAASDGATPTSHNRMAQTTRNDDRIGFSLIFFVGGIIGGHAALGKSDRRDLGGRCYCLLISA